MDQVGGSLFELYFSQKVIDNREPFKGICRDHIITFDALRELIDSNLDKKIVQNRFDFFLLSDFYQITSFRMKSFPRISGSSSIFIEIYVCRKRLYDLVELLPSGKRKKLGINVELKTFDQLSSLEERRQSLILQN